LGKHNLSNALAALVMANKAGLSLEELTKNLATFPGVERRLQVLIDQKNRVLIDDYAHHPTEIKAVFETLKLSFPEDKKCVVFQPHLFSRTRDFMEDFASVLSLFDRVILLEIYPARELPIPGINAQALMNKIKGTSVELVSKKELGDLLTKVNERIIAILGAGDIGAEVVGLKHKLMLHEIT
jgi:UDP-N-acetylmuramate--alanine ligase